MFKPISFLKNLPLNNRPCFNCEGTGVLIIKNVYDTNYEEKETCSVCEGLGYIVNKNQHLN